MAPGVKAKLARKWKIVTKPRGTVADSLPSTNVPADDSSSEWTLEEESEEEVLPDPSGVKKDYKTDEDIEIESAMAKQPQAPSEPPWHKQDFKVDKDVMVCIL